MNHGDRLAVIARVRPLSKTELARKEHSVVAVCNNSISLRYDRFETAQNGKIFRLDSVLDENSNQCDVFDQIEPMLQTALEGYNTSIFTYGQSGSGKTYSMLGDDLWAIAKERESLLYSPKQHDHGDYNNSLQSAVSDIFINPDNIGIIPRTTDWLFDITSIRKEQGTDVKIFVSYLEIQNERLVDLLNSSDPVASAHHSPSRGISSIVGPTFSTTTSSKQVLNIREIDGDVTVKGLTLIEVESAKEIREVLWIGAKARSIAATDLNEHSSRSHTIFQIHVELSDTRTMLRTRSKISLVDLAGSERLQAHLTTNISQERIRELKSINRSLSSLSNCISALVQKSRVHIPYRDSKLTRLLQHSLGGNTRSAFIVTLSPSISCYEDTLSTLKFASRAIKVALQTAPNRSVFGRDVTTFNEKNLTELEHCKGEIMELKRMVEILLQQRNDTVSPIQPLRVHHEEEEKGHRQDQYNGQGEGEGQDWGMDENKNNDVNGDENDNDNENVNDNEDEEEDQCNAVIVPQDDCYTQNNRDHLCDTTESNLESHGPRSAHNKIKENDVEKKNKIKAGRMEKNVISKKDDDYSMKKKTTPLTLHVEKVNGYLKRDLSRYVVQPSSNNRSSSPSPSPSSSPTLSPKKKIVQNSTSINKSPTRKIATPKNTDILNTKNRVENGQVHDDDDTKQYVNIKDNSSNYSNQNSLKGKNKLKSEVVSDDVIVSRNENECHILAMQGSSNNNNNDQETSKWHDRCSASSINNNNNHYNNSRSRSLSEQGLHGRDGTGGIPTSSSTLLSSTYSSDNSDTLKHSHSSGRHEEKVRGTLRPTARSSSFCSDDNNHSDHPQSTNKHNSKPNSTPYQYPNSKSDKYYNGEGREIKENCTQRYVEVLEGNKVGDDILERVRVMEASVRTQAEELVKAKHYFAKVYRCDVM